MIKGYDRGVEAAKNPHLIQNRNPYPDGTFEYERFKAGKGGTPDPNVVAPISYTLDQLHPR